MEQSIPARNEAADAIEETLQRYIAEQVAFDGRGLRREEKLIESGRIDSLGLVNILAFIGERFGVDLLACGEPKDFESIAALAAAVRRERAGVERESA